MAIEAKSRPDLGAPHLTYPSRGIFESAQRNGNIALEHLTRLDYWTDQLLHKSTLDVDISQQINERQEVALEVISKANQNRILRPQHIYRLTSAVATLEEMIFVPRAFHDVDSTKEQRSESTQHLAGTHTGILEDLLEKQRQTDIKQDRTDYAGMISEQTFLAALNATYDPDIAAVQSLVHEDLQQKVDAWVYLRDGETCYTVPVQIKTSLHNLESSKKILYIPMNRYNSTLHLSRGLISLMSGEEMDEVAQTSLNNLVEFVKRNGPPIGKRLLEITD